MRRALAIAGAALVVSACWWRSAAPPARKAPVPAPPVQAPAPPRAWPETAGEREIVTRFAKVVENCRVGNRAACRRLAQRLHFATNDREYALFAPALAAACEQDVGPACGGYGLVLLQGLGVRADVERGLRLLKRGCDRRDDISCAELGEVYLSGAYGQADKQDEGNRMLRHFCTVLGGWPCATTAQLDARAGNVSAMRRGMDNACDTGDAYACYLAGVAYATGKDGFPDDAAEAVERHERACAADLGAACYQLALHHRRGTGVPQNEARAKEILLEACKLGEAAACDDLATVEILVDRSAYQRYCDLWGASSCFLAAEQIGKAKGEVAETAQQVIANGVRSCQRGHVPGCNAMHHLTRDFMAMCSERREVRNSCTFAGFLHLYGVTLPPASGGSVPADRARAVAAFESACTAGAPEACDQLKALK